MDMDILVNNEHASLRGGGTPHKTNEELPTVTAGWEVDGTLILMPKLPALFQFGFGTILGIGPQIFFLPN